MISKDESLKGKNVLVTGAGGFIGSHLTQLLVRSGCRVTAFVRYNSRNHAGHIDSLKPEIRSELEVVSGDIRDEYHLQSLFAGKELVFHLCALIGIPFSYVAPSSYVGVNVQGTMNVLQATLKHSCRLIHTSTSEVYGSSQYLPMDEAHPLRPQSPYAATKLAADNLALSYYYSFGLPVTVVRPFNTYGPRQSMRAVIPTIIAQALAGNKIRLGLTTSIRDLTYVEDTCSGMIAAATSQNSIGQTCNLGTGEGYSITDLVEKVGAALDKPLEIEHDSARVRPDRSEVVSLVSSYRLARESWGWKPSVDIDTGLSRVIESMTNEHSLSPSEYVV